MKTTKTPALFAILLAAVLMPGMGAGMGAGAAAMALAADSVVSFTDGNVVAFAPGSAASATSLFDDFEGIMPGDVREESIAIVNESTTFDYLKVYLRAVPHDESNAPVAPVSAADSNAFLAQLGMKVWNGTDLIYSDSPDKPGALATGAYLGQIASGESLALRVELSVPLDLGNEFAGRMGEVDWVFTFEGFDVDVLTVRKVWTGNTADVPESVDVELLQGDTVADVQTLSAANAWTYTWVDLDQDFAWDVREVALEGYEVTYTREGNDILIENFMPGEPDPEPIDLTVVKRWAEADVEHPSSVTVVLYNGAVAVERVTLDEANGWTHAWTGLDGAGAWRVVETNIDGAWAPSYSADGNVVTVTNTHRLIDTGQLRWPVAVLAGLGVLLVACGVYLVAKRRKDSRA